MFSLFTSGPKHILRITNGASLVTNPIYEGSSDYEDLDGYQNRSGGAYASLGPPALPPPRVKDPAEELSTSDVHKPGTSTPDEYVVMNPVQPDAATVGMPLNTPVHPRTEGNTYIITEC